MASTTIIQATESFNFVGPNGAPVSIRKGETFHKEAKRLEGISSEALEKNFKPFVPNHGIESATAAPGERRKGGPRSKATPTKEDDGSAGDAGSAEAETADKKVSDKQTGK